MVRELDMGFTVEEVVEGIARLLARLGMAAASVFEGHVVRFRPEADLTIEVARMPEERIRHPILFPRTLLVLRGPEPAIEALERQVLLAFLRVGG
jgi:hypothetical protein